MKKIVTVVCILSVSLMFISGRQKYERVKPEGGEIKIAIKKVNDGKAHYFRTSVDEGEVKFFVLMSDDGVVRVAFDACDVCFPEKKGYAQNGDFMICNNCGRSFHETKINVVKGGCNPAPVDRIFDKEYVYIHTDELQRGIFYF